MTGILPLGREEILRRHLPADEAVFQAIPAEMFQETAGKVDGQGNLAVQGGVKEIINPDNASARCANSIDFKQLAQIVTDESIHHTTN